MNKSEVWHSRLAEAVDALAGETFYERFAACCSDLSGQNNVSIVWLDRDQQPVPIYANTPELLASPVVQRWLKDAYRLDPAFGLFETGASAGVYALSDIAPDAFFSTSFYRKFYQVLGLADELLLLVRVGETSAVLITLANPSGNVMLEEARTALAEVFPVLAALCSRHQTAAGGEVNFSGPLKKAFDNFGRDVLTGREREVVHLLLKGHSSRAIAGLLGLSVNTIKVYTKRFHKKLEVSSQAELFSLFFEAISLCPFDADVDPLSHYRRLTRHGQEIRRHGQQPDFEPLSPCAESQ